MTQISVIMPVHNTEKYVDRAIESILNQTYWDFELIVIDDASTDKSLDIVNHYKNLDPRIVIFTNKTNQGISRSRNIGLQNARGEFIAVMDSDDVSHPERFEKQIDYLNAHPKIGVIGANYTVVDENGIAYRTSKLPESPPQIWWTMFFSNSIAHSSAMIRRSILVDRKITYSEEFSCAVDYDLFFQIMRYSPMVNLPDSLFLYRQHGKNISKTNRSDQEFIDATITRSHTQDYLTFQLPENYGSALKDYRNIKTKKDAYNICRAMTGLYRKVKVFNPDMTLEDEQFIKTDYSSRVYKLWKHQLTNPLILPYLFYALIINQNLLKTFFRDLLKHTKIDG